MNQCRHRWMCIIDNWSYKSILNKTWYAYLKSGKTIKRTNVELCVLEIDRGKGKEMMDKKGNEVS